MFISRLFKDFFFRLFKDLSVLQTFQISGNNSALSTTRQNMHLKLTWKSSLPYVYQNKDN